MTTAASAAIAMMDDARAIGRWWRVAGGVAMNFGFGSLYAWSVFVAPLEQQFGWARSDTSFVFTVAVFVTALSFVLAGWINDRWGPRPCAIAGSILFGLGLWLSSYSTSLTYLFVCFGIIGGLGGGLGCAVIIPTIARWFPDRRGLAIGIIIGAYGAGSAVIGPVAQLLLIPSYGVGATFKILGAVFAALSLAGALLMRAPAEAPQTRGESGHSIDRDLTPRRVLSTRVFYLMWGAFALGSSSGLMVISQLVPFAVRTGLHGSAVAALGLVVGAAGNTCGRVLSGWLSDVFGRMTVLRMVLAISAVATPALAHSSSMWAVCLFVFLVYATYGTQLSVNPAATADAWGIRHAGSNYGMLFTAWGVAGVIGPRIGARLYDASGEYTTAFYCAGALSAIALLLEVFARPYPPE